MGSNILVLKMKSSVLVTYLILGISFSSAEDFSLDKALTKLDITPDVFENLVNGSRTVKRDTITNLLKKQLNKHGLILDETPAEVRLSQIFLINVRTPPAVAAGLSQGMFKYSLQFKEPRT